MGDSGRLRSIRSKLSLLRLPELRNVLNYMNLHRSGRKQEIIDRIAVALESFEAKALEHASNHTTAAYYADQLSGGLGCIDMQISASRPHHAVTSPPSASVTGAMPLAHTPPSSRYASAPSMPAAPVRSIPSYHHRPAVAPSSNGHHHHPQLQRAPPTTAYAPSLSSSAPRSNGNGLPPSTNVEILTGVTLPSLQNARCLCINDAATGKVISCSQCGLIVHAKCHQLAAVTVDEWYCENCRSKVFDPFLSVVKTVRPANFVRFAKSFSTYRIEYHISDQDLNEMYSKRDAKPGAMTPGTLELQLRCFALKDELADGHRWPASSQINVNGFNVPLVQRAPPGQANPSKVLRELPINLFPFTRVGRNLIELRTNENPPVYAFMVQIVSFRDCNDLIKEITQASAKITLGEATQTVIKSFGDEDEDDVVATSTVLSVRCPLGLGVINLPARGLHCKHLQCFDLRTFLLFSKKARSKAWRCTICHNFIKASDLRIDPYLKKLLVEVENEDELEEVEILPDASWKRRITDDAASAPPAKKVKREPTEVSSTAIAPAPAAPVSATSSAASTPAAASGSSASAPFEIDLSLSSDEEDDAPSTTSAPAPVPTRTQPAMLLDSEVSVLTVDSNIWETPSANYGLPRTTQGDAGHDSEGFPFAFAAPAAGERWDSFYDLPLGSLAPTPAAAAPSGSNASGYASTAPASASGTWANQPEADLASSMAMFSRKHPNVVSNPFAQRQGAATTTQSRAPAPRRLAEQDPLDIICLLDSDSE